MRRRTETAKNAETLQEKRSNDPIGVFDSGVGGLSVLRDIRRELPAEDLFYVADSGNAPYGDRSREFIEARSLAIVQFLAAQGAKAIVVACNTATGVAIKELRARFSLPIVGMEPAVKPAASSTKSGVIGVLATSQTVASEKFVKLVDGFRDDVKVLIQPCPGLAEQVEKGATAASETAALVEKYVRPLVAQGADTIVLGCTHYHFLRAPIEAAAGPGVQIVDPQSAIARQLRRRLDEQDLLSTRSSPGSERFWTSAPIDTARPIMARLWSEGINVERLTV